MELNVSHIPHHAEKDSSLTVRLTFSLKSSSDMWSTYRAVSLKSKIGTIY